VEVDGKPGQVQDVIRGGTGERRKVAIELGRAEVGQQLGLDHRHGMAIALQEKIESIRAPRDRRWDTDFAADGVEIDAEEFLQRRWVSRDQRREQVRPAILVRHRDDERQIRREDFVGHPPIVGAMARESRT